MKYFPAGLLRGYTQAVATFRAVLAKPSSLSLREWDGIGVVWTLVILCLTTMPWTNFRGHAHWDDVVWVPFSDACWRLWFPADVLGNLLLFVPFGWCTTLAERNPRPHSLVQLTLMAAALSLAVELFQVFSHNRSPSMTDSCMNTAGAVLGALQAVRCQEYTWKSAAHDRGFAVDTPRRNATVSSTPAPLPEP